MDFITNILSAINGVVWGVPMLVGILGIGLFMQFRLSFLPIRKLGTGFKLLFEKK
ncbi:sodium:alanine symporter [Proteus mirabilis]|uniref:Sodium:alanine symporter n=1 Tax=Proteus mirabilis TaxID=584 RepID=A0A2X2DHJ5_PROMI|nr:sodium:alanine symporter [Proteus mirabilis]